MKKTIIVFSLFLASCGGSDTKTIEATYADTPGPDSSVILPAEIKDSIKTDDKKPLDTLSAQ